MCVKIPALRCQRDHPLPHVRKEAEATEDTQIPASPSVKHPGPEVAGGDELGVGGPQVPGPKRANAGEWRNGTGFAGLGLAGRVRGSLEGSCFSPLFLVSFVARVRFDGFWGRYGLLRDLEELVGVPMGGSGGRGIEGS